jgi:hypothetical protein
MILLPYNIRDDRRGLCNTALWVPTHFGVGPKVRYTSHSTLGSNTLWAKNREIDPKVR